MLDGILTGTKSLKEFFNNRLASSSSRRFLVEFKNYSLFKRVFLFNYILFAIKIIYYFNIFI